MAVYKLQIVDEEGNVVQQDDITPIEQVNVEVSQTTGEASGSASYGDGVLDIHLQGIKGERGVNGLQGIQGKQGVPGESAVFDPSTGNISVIKQNTGYDVNSPMSQNAVMEKFLSEKYNYGNIDTSELTEYANYVYQGKWANSSGAAAARRIIMIPVTPRHKYIVENINAISANFTVLNTDEIVVGQQPSYARGWTWMSGRDSFVVEIPNNGFYLCLQVHTSDVEVPWAVRHVLGSGMASSLGYDDFTPISQKAVSDNICVDGDAININSYSVVSKFISTLNVWAAGTVNVNCRLIPVNPGEMFRIVGNASKYSNYAFLTSEDAQTVDTRPKYAAGYMVRAELTNSESVCVTAPADAAYLYISNKSSGEDFSPSAIIRQVPIKDKLIGIETPLTKTVRVRLQHITLNTANGAYGYNPDNRKFHFSTAKLYRVPNSKTISLKFFNDTTNLYYCGYDKNMMFISAINDTQTKGTATVVTFPSTWEYFKIGLFVAANEGTEDYPDIVDVEMTGVLPHEFEHYNMPQGNADADGNWNMFMTIAIDTPTPCTQDIETATVTDAVNIQFDHGMLSLPSSYTADGSPTRLIIFCHGSAKHITPGQSTWPTDAYGVDPKYWLSEGYAVMDMDGLPNDVATAHWCVPVAYQCYLAAYKFAIENYNICKDGIFLGGRSLGGAMALTIMSFEQIPILACCPFAPAGPEDVRRFYGFSAGQKAAVADACGIYNPDGVQWTANSFPDVLKMEYAMVNGHEKYIGNFGRLMQYSHSYRLIANNPSVEVLTDERMFSSDSATYEQYLLEVYGSCEVRTRIPVKFFGAYDDATVPPRRVNLWAKMFRNGGCVMEQRMFPTGGHPFDLADVNRVQTFINSKGVTMTNVPIAYIESLQFWRRYE